MARYSVRAWVLLALLALGCYDVVYIVQWSLASPQPPFGDFFSFWSFGRFGKDFGAAIYDPVALSNYEHELDPALSGSYPFAYPPTLLLAVIPLGLMTLPAAYLVWVTSGLVAYILATLGRSWRSLYGLGLLVAPTTLLSIISGQNGFFSAALLVGGLRSLKAKPILGGILLALLTFKPQFALLLPVILLRWADAAALWAFILTIVTVIVATSFAFGWSIWPDWVRGFFAFHHLLQVNQSDVDRIMTTIMAGIHILGLPAIIAYAVQLAVLLAVVLLCWRKFAQGMNDDTVAMAIVGSLLVAPYAMIYDAPMIASAVALHWRTRARTAAGIGIREVILVIAMFETFSAMLTVSLPLVAPVLMLTMFLVINASSEAQGGYGVSPGIRP